MTTTLIPLPAVPRLLLSRYGVRVSYKRLYFLAVDGHIQAERAPTGRWSIDERHLPDVLEAAARPVPKNVGRPPKARVTEAAAAA